MSPSILEARIQIACRRDAGPQAKLHSGAETALYVYAPVVIFELRLAAKDHQEEFFIGRVREFLVERTYFFELLIVHEIDQLPKIARVSTQPIRSPSKDGVV